MCGRKPKDKDFIWYKFIRRCCVCNKNKVAIVSMVAFYSNGLKTMLLTGEAKSPSTTRQLNEIILQHVTVI